VTHQYNLRSTLPQDNKGFTCDTSAAEALATTELANAMSQGGEVEVSSESRTHSEQLMRQH